MGKGKIFDVRELLVEYVGDFGPGLALLEAKVHLFPLIVTWQLLGNFKLALVEDVDRV